MYRPEGQSTNEANNKEPWLAVNLSWLLPGIGQIYAGKSVKGYSILFGYLLSVGIGGWLIIGSNYPLVGVAVLILGLIFLPILNLFDAHRSARSVNSEEFELARKQNKDAWLAVFLSYFIPGLGHAYLKKWLPGILFFITFIIIVIGGGLLSPIGVVFAKLLQAVLALIVFYNVYNSAPIRRERSARTINLFIAGFIGIPVILAPLLALAIRQFVAEARYIPSGAMIPTLQINDRLIVDKLTYRFSNPQRGDIVVFNPTAALEREKFKDAFIKRIIGLPGDRIDVKAGKVYINGKVINENYLEEAPNYNWSSTALTPDGKVPPNEYLVLGDNRNNSYDGHYWGFVPRAKIIGKATTRFWPIDRSGSITRPDYNSQN